MSASSDNLPVECLLLQEHMVMALRRAGVSTIGQFRRFQAAGQPDDVLERQELQSLGSLVEGCWTHAGMDWARYWQCHDLNFDRLFVSLPEFDRLDQESRTHPVDRGSLGLAGRAFANVGYHRLGELVDALRTGVDLPAGVGPKKLREFFDLVVQLAGRVDPEGHIVGFSPSPPGDSEANGQTVAPVPAVLPEQVACLSIDVLHIGIKSRLLIKAGVATVGELVQTDRKRLMAIPGLGRRSVDAALGAVHHLLAASDSARIDWDRYCDLMQLPLLPAQQYPDGPSFVAGLHTTIGDFASQLDDAMLRDIVTSRLTVRPHEQDTLEEIAARHTPHVSRERVRQKEKKLLGQLAGALVWGEDHGLSVHFHPDFRLWWRLAAEEFLGAEDIDLGQFLQRLAATWHVDQEALIPELPIILAIVTGEPQVPAAYRSMLRINPQLLGMPAATGAIPLRHLRLGKRGVQLEERGISNLGELVDAARRGAVPREVSEHLEILATCLIHGQFCRESYRRQFAPRVIPECYADEPGAFADTFCSVVALMLDQLSPTVRAAQIFRERTCLGEAQRPTLDQIAQRLGTFGPSVKREETILLEELHDVLVDGQFGLLPFWIDEGWLSRFRQAASLYQYEESQSGYHRFVANLAALWGLAPERVEKASPALWAILSGYPAGRKRGPRASATTYPAAEAPVSPLRIRLRGFRRVH